MTEAEVFTMFKTAITLVTIDFIVLVLMVLTIKSKQKIKTTFEKFFGEDRILYYDKK